MRRQSTLRYVLSAVVMFSGLIALPINLLYEKLTGFTEKAVDVIFKLAFKPRPVIEKTRFSVVTQRDMSLSGLIGMARHVSGRSIGGCVQYSAAA